MPHTRPLHRFGLIVVSVAMALVALELFLRLSGWAVLSWQAFVNSPDSRSDGIRVLCLGESTTALPFQAPYPKLLEQMLNTSANAPHYQVINKGVSGYTSSDIRKHLNKNLRQYHPHIVVVMMGVNDPLKLHSENYSVIPSAISSLRLYKLYRHLAMSFHSGFSKEYDVPGVANEVSQKLYQEGMVLIKRKDYPSAIDAFVRSWNADKQNYEPMMAWAGLQEALGNVDEAEQVFLKFLKHNPRHVQAQYDLIELYETHTKEGLLEQALTQRMINHIFDPQAVQQLAQFYFKRGEIDRANELLQGSHVMPEKQVAHELASLGDQHIHGDAVFRSYFNKYRQDPMAHRYFGLAATHFLEQGRRDLAQPYYQAARSIRQQRKHPVTVENFEFIKSEVQSRNVRLILMQYPLRRADEMRRWLTSLEDVVLVENYENFHRALQDHKYTDLFWDYFAGDFGHATQLGNQLIAENLAQHILALE